MKNSEFFLKTSASEKSNIKNLFSVSDSKTTFTKARLGKIQQPSNKTFVWNYGTVLLVGMHENWRL